MSERRMSRRVHVVALALFLVGVLASPAWAHEHRAEPAHGGEGQVLANGQNHPAFQDNDGDGKPESCESYPQPANFGPAWYGLETAHHGPDSGDPGKGDGCYEADAPPGGPLDDQNPAIG